MPKPGKRNGLILAGILVAVLVCLVILLGPAAPFFVRLGVKPICIQGSWPDLRVVSCPEWMAALPTVTPLPTLSGQAPIPIIVDDDGSPDGVMALLYFLRNPLFDVKAVTISCGEAHPAVFADHILQLLAGLGRADIPVGVGRETSLEGNNTFPEPWREGSDAFWDIQLPPATVSTRPVPAAELIVETVSGSPQPVLVFVSGNHTNLAEALRLAPGIGENIRAIHIMGGSLHVPGNINSDWPEIDNRVAEWNIWVDPVAAREVFASGRPVYVTPLDATNQVTWTESDARAWASSAAPEGELAGNVLQWMLRSWSPDGVFVWDLVAAITTSDARLCPAVLLAMDVNVTPGPEQGRILITEQSPNSIACLEPDVGQIKANAASILGR